MTNQNATPAPMTGGRPGRAPFGNRMILALLRSPLHRLLGGGLLALRYPVGDGRIIELPVSCVRSDRGFVVLVGAHAGKRWWRHFRSPAAVEVWQRGAWRPTTARLITADSTEYPRFVAAYGRRPAAEPTTVHDPFVLITAPPTVSSTVLSTVSSTVSSTESSTVSSTVSSTDPVPQARSARGLWRSWTGWVTAGEFLGFSVPALAGALSGSGPAPAMAVLLVAAGAIEGTVLGAAQGHVLRRVLPDLNYRRWVVATACGAALAWAIGLVPMLTDGRLFDLPTVMLIPVAAVLGAVLLASIGTAQWLVLRTSVQHSRWWILTTAGAWTAGLLIFTAVTTPLWQPGQSVLAITAIGVLGGLLMAATVAALTGWALLRLVRNPATNGPAARSVTGA